jgi:hypothetical protein
MSSLEITKKSPTLLALEAASAKRREEDEYYAEAYKRILCQADKRKRRTNGKIPAPPAVDIHGI